MPKEGTVDLNSNGTKGTMVGRIRECPILPRAPTYSPRLRSNQMGVQRLPQATCLWQSNSTTRGRGHQLSASQPRDGGAKNLIPLLLPPNLKIKSHLRTQIDISLHFTNILSDLALQRPWQSILATVSIQKKQRYRERGELGWLETWPAATGWSGSRDSAPTEWQRLLLALTVLLRAVGTKLVSTCGQPWSHLVTEIRVSRSEVPAVQRGLRTACESHMELGEGVREEQGCPPQAGVPLTGRE